MNSHLPNIRHLYALHEVAKSERINLAADRVNLSQPAVTQAVASQERALGAPLFERRPTGMLVTKIGEIYLRRVDRALDLLKQGERQARGKSSEKGRRDFHRLATSTQLRAFVEVARTGSYSRAAHRVGVSQPAVHRAAKDLEHVANISFFEPARRGIALTPAAEIFVQHVLLASAELRQGRFEVSAYQGRDTTRIAIGSLPLSRNAVLPEAIDRFLATSDAQVQVSCVDAPYDILLKDLRTGELDLIIGALRNPPPEEDLVQKAIFDDQLQVVTRTDHPLAQRSQLTLEDTFEYPWITPPAHAPSGAYLRERMRSHQPSKSPTRVVSSSLSLARELLCRGDYVTLLSRRQIEWEMQRGLLTALDVDLGDSARTIGLTFRRAWQPTPTQSRFLSFLEGSIVSAASDLPASP